MKLFGNTSRKSGGKRQKVSRDETGFNNDNYGVNAGENKTPTSGGSRERMRKNQYKVKKSRLTGLQKGLIILAAAVVFLVVLVAVLWKNFAVLPDRSSLPPVMSSEASDQVTLPPQQSQSIDVSAVPSNEPEVKVTSTSVIAVDTGDVSLGEMLTVPGDRREGVYTVLLVGTDKSEFLTDTMMVCSFDTKKHTLKIVSIPRDSFISFEDSSYKMNSVFSEGYRDNKSMEDGMDALVEQVSLLTGFTPDAYCMINLESFVEIIDVIGGIDFEVPMDMKYSDPMQNLEINLSKGYQHLTGDQCMQLVRFRSGYASADIQRMSVQQDFLKAVANKMLSIGTVGKIPELAEIVFDNLYTNLTLGNICAFAEQLLKVKADEIETTTFLGEPGAWNGGVSYYFLYGYDNLDIINEYLNPYDEDLTINDVYIYTLEHGVITRSTRSTTTNNHSFSTN